MRETVIVVQQSVEGSKIMMYDDDGSKSRICKSIVRLYFPSTGEESSGRRLGADPPNLVTVILPVLVVGRHVR
jgi:hypothetical protein